MVLAGRGLGVAFPCLPRVSAAASVCGLRPNSRVENLKSLSLRFFSAPGSSAPGPAGVKPVQGLLGGLKVIELGQVIAAPYAGSILGDLGADVLKIERPGGGDDARRMGADFARGDAIMFHTFNRSKGSKVLDLTTDDGKSTLYSLLESTDILIHNLRPDVPPTLGLDPSTLTTRFPRLIHGSISAFGHLGPLANRPGFEPLIQAYSGLSSLNGGPEDPPIRSAASLCDQGSGMWLVIGLLAVLHRRNATGLGGLVQTSLLEAALHWAGQKADEFVNTGKLPERSRSGHPAMAPYEAFEAADGPLLICAGNDRLFAKLATASGRSDWVTDPRFATNRARLVNKPALFAELCPIILSKPRKHWVALLDKAGVPASPIHTLPEALEQPQVQALQMLQKVPGESFKLTALPLSLDGERPSIKRVAPRLGEV